MQLQQMPELRQLAIEIFIHGIKSLLQFPFCQLADGVVSWVVIHVWKKDGLGKWRFDVLA